MLKILVTGGAGYIGSLLTAKLLEKGHSVKVLDNFLRGREAIKTLGKCSNLTVIEGDIRDRTAVSKAVRDVDMIVHLAALVGYPLCDRYPVEAEEINVRGSALIDEARGGMIPVIFSSTGSVYGLQVRECSEDTAPNPTSLYAAEKLRGEEIFLGSGNAIALRFATGFGLSLKMRHDLLINSFVCEALNKKNLVIYEKSAYRSFIHISDMVRCIEFMLENFGNFRDRIFNAGDEALAMKKGELAGMICGMAGGTVTFNDFDSDRDSRNFRMSFKKIRDAGFMTGVDLRTGVEELIRFYRGPGAKSGSNGEIDPVILLSFQEVQ
ncbi:MAG: NAD(P)-dependent oxidoreductase [Deltaproteobacteria bacterium]|nr:NAD(P)-dependent oxidoreductase [Deltaproteobacteria bacterium]